MGRTKRERPFIKSQAEIRREIIKRQDKSTKLKRVVTGWVLDNKNYNLHEFGLSKTKKDAEQWAKIMGRNVKAVKIKVTIEEM